MMGGVAEASILNYLIPAQKCAKNVDSHNI